LFAIAIEEKYMIVELAQEAAELIKVYRDKNIVIDNWQYRVQALLIAVAQLQQTNNSQRNAMAVEPSTVNEQSFH
jgi:hypothetical protein